MSSGLRWSTRLYSFLNCARLTEGSKKVRDGKGLTLLALPLAMVRGKESVWLYLLTLLPLLFPSSMLPERGQYKDAGIGHA